MADQILLPDVSSYDFTVIDEFKAQYALAVANCEWELDHASEQTIKAADKGYSIAFKRRALSQSAKSVVAYSKSLDFEGEFTAENEEEGVFECSITFYCWQILFLIDRNHNTIVVGDLKEIHPVTKETVRDFSKK